MCDTLAMRHLSHVVAVALFGRLLSVSAQTFTKIADTLTPVASGAGNYTGFNNGAAIDAAGNVAFTATSSGGTGVYYSNGGNLVRVADSSTAIPSGTGNFTFFNSFVSTAGGNVAFNAGGDSGQSGIHVYNGSTLTRWVDSNTAIPSGSGTFTGGVRAPYLRGSQVAYLGQNSDFSQQGIYVTDGTTAPRLVDKTSVIPGISGSYGWSSQLAFDNGNVAFAANNSPGAFTILGGYTPGGGLVTLASTATAAPGAGANFTRFESPPDLSGNSVFFKGSFTGGSGVYQVEVGGGTITNIANTSMAAIGASGNFTGFEGHAISDGRYAFIGSFGAGNAIYLSNGGTPTWLVGTGDMIDGNTVTSVGFGSEAISGDFLVFRADFSGGSGLYSTQLMAIPEPSVYATLAGALALGFVMWRRRRLG